MAQLSPDNVNTSEQIKIPIRSRLKKHHTKVKNKRARSVIFFSKYQNFLKLFSKNSSVRNFSFSFNLFDLNQKLKYK